MSELPQLEVPPGSYLQAALLTIMLRAYNHTALPYTATVDGEHYGVRVLLPGGAQAVWSISDGVWAFSVLAERGEITAAGKTTTPADAPLEAVLERVVTFDYDDEEYDVRMRTEQVDE